MTSLVLLCSESKTGKSKDVNIPDSQVVKMAVTDSGNDQQINESLLVYQITLQRRPSQALSWLIKKMTVLLKCWFQLYNLKPL